MKKRYLFWITLLSLLTFTTGVYAQDNIAYGTLVHDGAERTYRLALPAETESAPLVIAYHPFASSSTSMAALTGLDRLADEIGAVVVYPDSLGYGWNTGSPQSIDIPADDVGFTGALIDQLAADYNIDSEQVTVIGTDSGGALVYHLACTIPERLAGAIVVNTLMREYQLTVCGEPTGQAVPVVIIAGTEDPVFPIEGLMPPGATSTNARALPLTGTMDFWLERNGCDQDMRAVSENGGAISYSECDEGGYVAMYSIAGGGHQWPRTGDYALNQVGFDATTLIASYLSGDARWFNTAFNTTQSDTPRSYLVYTPPGYDGSEPVPVVVVLHGRPGSGAGMAYITGMNRVADEEGFIVVYPEGLNQEWYYIKDVPLYPDRGYDDVEFLKVLMDDLAVDFNIDRERLYVTGFSNGGFMTQRMACSATDTFAAFGVVGAALRPEMADLCASTEPAPVIHIQGTADVSIPWNGVRVPVEIVALSIADTVAFWAGRNGCTAAYTYEELPASGLDTQVYSYQFSDCAVDYAFYAIANGGHNWPGVPGIISEQVAGRVNTDIHASEVIWDFFSRYTLSDR